MVGSGTMVAVAVVVVAAVVEGADFGARALRPFLGGAGWDSSGAIEPRSTTPLVISFSGNLYLLYLVSMFAFEDCTGATRTGVFAMWKRCGIEGGWQWRRKRGRTREDRFEKCQEIRVGSLGDEG